MNVQNDKALAAVPMMQELSDDKLRELMGGIYGRYFSMTCECGCGICTSWVYACTY